MAKGQQIHDFRENQWMVGSFTANSAVSVQALLMSGLHGGLVVAAMICFAITIPPLAIQLMHIREPERYDIKPVHGVTTLIAFLVSIAGSALMLFAYHWAAGVAFVAGIVVAFVMIGTIDMRETK